MPDFTLTFWGGWIAGIVLLGIAFLAWLATGVFFAAPGTAEPPAQTWDDDLREGDDAPPKWWFFALFAALIFSCVYMLLYPGFGDWRGVFGWTQQGQLAAGTAHYESRHGDNWAKWEAAPLAELAADESAMATARRLFANNCAACHGDDGSGRAGLFPDLTDGEWQWGDGDAILHSITAGRVAAMPAWGEVLGEKNVQAVADYVLALSVADDPAVPAGDPTLAAGREVYAANCIACHGAAGEGNPLLGAPRFRNHNWHYHPPDMPLLTAIRASIRDGRQGVMPAQEGRLSPGQIRLLAAWLGAN